MADHFLISASEVYVVKLTEEKTATTTGGGGDENRNRKSRNSTSKKRKPSNNDNLESKNSKPKLNPKTNPTSFTALSLERNTAVGPVPLTAPNTATPSVKGLYPTTTTLTTTDTTAAAATSKIPFSVPLRFAAAVSPLLSSKDVMRGEEDVLRDVEVGTRSLIRYLSPKL